MNEFSKQLANINVRIPPELKLQLEKEAGSTTVLSDYIRSIIGKRHLATVNAPHESALQEQVDALTARLAKANKLLGQFAERPV